MPQQWIVYPAVADEPVYSPASALDCGWNPCVGKSKHNRTPTTTTTTTTIHHHHRHPPPPTPIPTPNTKLTRFTQLHTNHSASYTQINIIIVTTSSLFLCYTYTCAQVGPCPKAATALPAGRPRVAALSARPQRSTDWRRRTAALQRPRTRRSHRSRRRLTRCGVRPLVGGDSDGDAKSVVLRSSAQFKYFSVANSLRHVRAEVLRQTWLPIVNTVSLAEVTRT